MRPGYECRTGHSSVMRQWVVRIAHQHGSRYTPHLFHRRLVGLVFVVIGLVGSPGIGLAGPVIVASEDTGGGPAVGAHLTVNQRVAARLFDEVFSQRKPDVCALLMTADANNHTPAGDFEGPAGFEQYVAEVWDAYPDATFAFDDGVAVGDLVTLNWTIGGQPAAGVRQLEGTAILRFEQNMIAESWLGHGSSGSARQVEVTPAAPEICPPCWEP